MHRLHQKHQSVLDSTLMKRATVTIPDDLEDAVERYCQAHEAAPALTTVVQAALRQYLSDRGYLRPSGPLRITPARKGSGRRDISQSHDKYLAMK
jgi:hypothetical protein